MMQNVRRMVHAQGRRALRGFFVPCTVASAPAYVSIDTAWGMYEGGSSRVVTFTGDAPTSVTVGGTAATITATGATTVTFTTPAASSATVGSVDIVLTNATGSSTGTAVFEYTSVGRAASVAGATEYAEWDPALGYSLTSGRVNSWTDQGNLSSKLTVTQGTAGKQPLWSASGGPNSKPCLTFDDARSDVLKKNSAGGMSSGVGRWVFWVVNRDAVSTISCHFDGPSHGGSAVGETSQRHLVSSGNKVSVTLHDGTGANATSSTTVFPDATWTLLDHTFAGGNNVRIYFNGTQAGTAASAAATAGKAVEDVAIGSRFSDIQFFKGSLAHGGIIGANKSVASALVLEKYLEEKYALTIATF